MTPNDDAYRLLSEYAAGNLTDAERDELARAALADPAVFEALVEEEELKAALEDTVFRRRVKERLRELGAEKEPYFTRLWQFIASPRGLMTTAGALASVALVVMAQLGVFRSTPALIQVNLGPPNVQATSSASLAYDTGADASFAKGIRDFTILPDAHAVLQLDRTGRRPTYEIGDRQRIGFRLEQDGSAVLLEERFDGGTYRLFPNRFQESADVKAGETVLVPRAGQGDLEVDGPAGERTLRLLIFPAGTNPLEGDSWERLRSQAKEVRKVYSVREKQ
jgi:hypothetical protein